MVELINDHSLFSLLASFSDIDDCLPESPDKDMISLKSIFLICNHIKALYLEVRFNQKSNVDINIDEFYQDG